MESKVDFDEISIFSIFLFLFKNTFHDFLIQGGLGGAEQPPARYKVKGKRIHLGSLGIPGGLRAQHLTTGPKT